MQRFQIVVEKAGKNHPAYLPDLSGCVTDRKTPEETEVV
jgi:predicted RNase H-like HicB family nuclease